MQTLTLIETTMLAHDGLLDNGLRFRPLTLPDYFIDHEKPPLQVAVGRWYHS